MITRAGRIDFPPHSGSFTIPLNAIFERPVLSVEVALVGYDARYSGEDHHVRQLTVSLDATVGARVDDGWEARVVATLCLRDDNNAQFSGWIDYLLFVELGKVPLPEISPVRPGVLEA